MSNVVCRLSLSRCIHSVLQTSLKHTLACGTVRLFSYRWITAIISLFHTKYEWSWSNIDQKICMMHQTIVCLFYKHVLNSVHKWPLVPHYKIKDIIEIKSCNEFHYKCTKGHTITQINGYTNTVCKPSCFSVCFLVNMKSFCATMDPLW